LNVVTPRKFAAQIRTIGKNVRIKFGTREVFSCETSAFIATITVITTGIAKTTMRRRRKGFQISRSSFLYIFSPDEGGDDFGQVHVNDFAVDPAAEFLKDFLAARDLKRKSMTELEKNQEAEDDIQEGTAVYSEIRTLELLKTGYAPLLTAKDDPWYFGFGNAEAFLTERLNNLRGARANAFEAKGKCYPYGGFQAVLLSRHFPGWQEGFFQKGLTLEQVLKDRLKLAEGEMKTAAGRFATRYPVEEISRRTGEIIGRRDAALEEIQGRRGRVYIIDFKPTQEYLNPRARGETYRVGLINLFLDGIECIQIQEVVLAGGKTPMIADQLYYVKWVDTETKPEEKGYSIAAERKEGDDVYIEATVTTKGFTLKAPKIRVQDTPSRVKIRILEKVRTGSR